MRDKHTFSLRQIDKARGDVYAIENELDVSSNAKTCPSTGRERPLPRFSERSHCAACLWGPDVVSNLQWQTIVAARVKDGSVRAASHNVPIRAAARFRTAARLNPNTATINQEHTNTRQQYFKAIAILSSKQGRIIVGSLSNTRNLPNAQDNYRKFFKPARY
jgi:hypothetical protein